MNELIDKVLTAAAIPVLILVGMGNIYILSLFRRASKDIQEQEKLNHER